MIDTIPANVIETLTEMQIEPSDGVMILLFRGNANAPEISIPQLGLMTEGKIEMHQMLLYRAVMLKRAEVTREAAGKAFVEGLTPSNKED